MNREIKFRAWDMEINEMDYFDLDSYDKNYHDNYGALQQYTGLHDKNGKEIYEGDILQTIGDNGERLSKFKIYYDNDGACFIKEREDGECYRIDSSQKWLEIIGNIYETPELINK